jgi:hypothetical protein
MIYIFRVVGAGFVKLGFTHGSPWTRVATGFWSNIHPKACCNKLGWDNLELLAVFDGSIEAELAIKQAIPPHFGEFWPECQLEALLNSVASLCSPLPLPVKPDQPPEVERATEKLPCCGGPEFFCDSCNASFHRAHHLRQHLQSCRGWKVSCYGCGRQFLQRNLKRHMSSCQECEEYEDQAHGSMSGV